MATITEIQESGYDALAGRIGFLLDPDDHDIYITIFDWVNQNRPGRSVTFRELAKVAKGYHHDQGREPLLREGDRRLHDFCTRRIGRAHRFAQRIQEIALQSR